MPMHHVLGRKDPNANFPYKADITAELADLGDTLDSATVEVVTANGEPDLATDLIVGPVTITSAGVITFWLSGGSANANGSEKRYFVRIRWRGAKLSPTQTVDDLTLIIPVGNR